MPGRTGVLALLLALPVWARVQGPNDSNVYYGKTDGAQSPAEIVAQTVFDAISEYQEIKKKGLKKEDAEYWVLLNKANEKFYKAVKKVAEENKYDVVTEKGSVKFDGKNPPDITQKVVDALDK